MKLSVKLKKVLMMTMVVSTVMSTAYAAPGLDSEAARILSEQYNLEQSSSVTVPKFFGTGIAVVTMGGVFDPLRGVSAYDGNGKDITDRITIEGSVNTADPGVYYLTYTAIDDNGVVGKILRTVIVDGKVSPEREETQFQGVTNIEINLGDTFDPLAGVRAIDSMDGDITRSIRVTSFVDTQKPSEYLVIYSVVNSGDMEAIAYRTVTVVADYPMPVIEGVEDVKIDLGQVFDPMAGVQAFDTEGVEITDRIAIEGHIRTSVEGIYHLTYRVMDNSGVETISIRRIEVKAPAVTKTTFFGVEETTIEMGTSFDPMMGITVIDPVYGNITNDVEATSLVDTSKEGTYLVTYTVTNAADVTTEAERTVHVVASIGRTTIKGLEEITITTIDTFDPMAGVTAMDTVDGDITASVKATSFVDTKAPGTYLVMYAVTNSSGVETKANRLIHVTQAIGETTLSGVEDVTITTGDTFDPMAGVTAIDTADGDITDTVVVTGTVDTTVEGTYTLTYTVTNSAGIETKANRTVIVEQAINMNPVFYGIEDETIFVDDIFTVRGAIRAVDVDGNEIKWTVTGNFDTSKVGVLELSYEATDAQGRTTTVIRKITITERN